jgi:hypothetical protein
VEVPRGIDAQPGPNGGIMILVCGQLLVREHNDSLLARLMRESRFLTLTQVDEEQNPLPFTQAFQLCQDAAGGWFVFNDIFKLVV